MESRNGGMRIPWAFEFFPVEPPATRVHCTTAKLGIWFQPSGQASNGARPTDQNHRFTFLAVAACLGSLSDSRFCPGGAASAPSFGASVAAGP
jgi:hypothetical protein